MTRSAEIAAKRHEARPQPTPWVEGLAAGTQKIGEVVTLIQNIASQTNLLALNRHHRGGARRRARQGLRRRRQRSEALANQTAKATEEISPRSMASRMRPANR